MSTGRPLRRGEGGGWDRWKQSWWSKVDGPKRCSGGSGGRNVSSDSLTGYSRKAEVTTQLAKWSHLL